MGEVVKLSAFAVISVLAALAVKNEKSSFGYLIGLAMGFMVLTVCTKRIRWVLELTADLASMLGEGNEYLWVLLKVLGITYVCDAASCICKDAGYGFLAGQLETLGKLSIMTTGMGILIAVIEQIQLLT